VIALAPADKRLTTAGLLCSGLVLAAGLIAMLSPVGVAVASGLLTLAAFVGLGGVSRREPGADLAIWVLLAAAMPLFVAFYAIGLAILRRLGQATAGGLLIAIAALLIAATAFVALRRSKRATA
jgi:hypothetical protein